MVAGREVIARGMRSEIIAWEPGKVLKLYLPGWSAAAVAGEVAATRYVGQLGIPSPTVYGAVEIDGRHGIILERIGGPSMNEAFNTDQSRYAQLARMLAEVQAAVHAHDVPDGPPQRRQLRNKINAPRSPLPADLKEAATIVLEGLPDGTAACHGDLHPMNVMLSPGRGPVIIDWDCPTVGNPLADVARTLLILLAGRWHVPSPQSESMRLMSNRIALIYLRRYFQLRHCAKADRRDLRTWLWVNAAARLAEGVQPEEGWLVGLVKDGIARRPGAR
ncbi:MAG: aminoglycoside phosphotransferase family protein [Bacillota bacterium]|nr:aminoglycoside phosphotransferase family protein [Bacillota bacterium]